MKRETERENTEKEEIEKHWHNRFWCVKKATENIKSIKHTQHTFNVWRQPQAAGKTLLHLLRIKKDFFIFYLFSLLFNRFFLNIFKHINSQLIQ